MFPSALAPTFPPLLTGLPVSPRTDPLQKAIASASTAEVAPGLVHYAEDDQVFQVALTLVPEQPLALAIRVGFAAMLGLNDALGALAPPEVAVHFTWPGGIKVNGAACGTLTMAASTSDPNAEPDWLIAAVTLSVASTHKTEADVRKDVTTLHDEGCGEITVPALIESWSRHVLVWINRYVEDGFGPLHAAWREKCDLIGEDVTEPDTGTFMGLDENGGMILRQETKTSVFPLTTMLDAK